MSLTVGIPFHHGADSRYFRQAVESICNQTMRPDELFLIQDGAVPESLHMVAEGALSEPWVRRIRIPESKGLAHALNQSVAHCKTTFYARMDADDIAEPERLFTQLSYLQEHRDVDVLGTWAMDINGEGHDISLRKTPTDHDSIVRYVWACPLIHPTVVFRTENFLKIGGYNEQVRRRQDYELWFRAVHAGWRFANLPRPLLRYRFTDSWFKRNDSAVLWEQVRMGWKGCRLVKAPFSAYAGTTFPLIKMLFPRRFGVAISNVCRRFDPRNKG